MMIYTIECFENIFYPNQGLCQTPPAVSEAVRTGLSLDYTSTAKYFKDTQFAVATKSVAIR